MHIATESQASRSSDVPPGKWSRAGLAKSAALMIGLTAILQAPSAGAVLPSSCQAESTHYRYPPELHEAMDALATRYPGLAEVVDYGDSYLKTKATGGYDLKALHITNRSTGGTKPVAFLVAGQHGIELPPPELLMRYAVWLLSRYGKDAEATYLVDEHDIWLVPVVNPDNLGLNRLNANGVDLNRNFSYQWILNGRLHGSRPASEPETSALEALASRTLASSKAGGPSDPIPSQTPGVFVDIHGHLNSNAYPWSHSTEAPPNLAQLKQLTSRMAKFNNYRSGQSAVLHYQASGTASDFGFGLLGVTSLLVELDGVARQPFASLESDYWPVNKGMLAMLTALSRAPLQLIDAPEITQIAVEETPSGFDLVTSATGDRTLDRIEYFVDLPPWREGSLPVEVASLDGAYDSRTESARAALDVQNLEPRRHMIYVRARDVTGAYGPVKVAWLNLDPTPAPTVVASSPQQITQAQAYNPLTFNVDAISATGEPLEYSWSVNGRVVESCGSGTLTYLPGDSDLGERQITVQATDGHKITSHTWQMTVAANNGVTPIIIDDAATATQQSGTWTIYSTQTGYAGRARYSDAAGAAFTFLPSLPQSGHHAVFARWPSNKTGGTAVPFHITHDGGTTTVHVNQRTGAPSNNWNLIGIFPMTQGFNGQVRIASAGGRPFADALLWAPVEQASPPLTSIVDNADTATLRTGTWTSSTASLPWGGAAMISSGAATFRWTPAVTASAHYDVYAWWTYGSNRDMAAIYRIAHADGESTTTVNQRDRTKAGRWNSLGRFRFDPRGGFIQLSGGTGTLSADAIKLVPASDY